MKSTKKPVLLITLLLFIFSSFFVKANSDDENNSNKIIKIPPPNIKIKKSNKTKKTEHIKRELFSLEEEIENTKIDKETASKKDPKRTLSHVEEGYLEEEEYNNPQPEEDSTKKKPMIDYGDYEIHWKRKK